MKADNLLIIMLFSLTFTSCQNHQSETKVAENESVKVELVDSKAAKQILTEDFQKIIDAAEVKGSVLIYDLQKDHFYSNDFDWANEGHLPASTFKIVNSIIALETGVVKDENTLFEWDGQKKRLKNWEQDLIFREAFHFSCVPCYQDIARRITAERMNSYLRKLDYGTMEVDSSNIDLFWLEGESKVSQFEQIDFLKRFYLSKLEITDKTESIMKRMMVIEENEQFKITGKTGWSIREGHNNGWFVGYIEVQEKVYFFACNVEPSEQFNMKMFSKIRKELTQKAFESLGVLDK